MEVLPSVILILRDFWKTCMFLCLSRICWMKTAKWGHYIGLTAISSNKHEMRGCLLFHVSNEYTITGITIEVSNSGYVSIKIYMPCYMSMNVGTSLHCILWYLQ